MVTRRKIPPFVFKSLAAYLFADRSQPRWGKSDRLLPPHAKKKCRRNRRIRRGEFFRAPSLPVQRGRRRLFDCIPHLRQKALLASHTGRRPHVPRQPALGAVSPCGFSPVRARCAARRRQKSISLIIPVFGSLRKLTIDWLPRAGAKSAALRSAESAPCDA